MDQVTPELFEVLRRLEPFGQGNPEPVFAARGVRMMAPPRVLKDKHVKLKLAAAKVLPPIPSVSELLEVTREDGGGPSSAAFLVTPRCHPDAAAFRREEIRAAAESRELKPQNHGWRHAITFDALAWRMAERMEQEKLIAGDTLDIAFTIGHNDHPEFGGLELTLCDFKTANEGSKQNEPEATKAHTAPSP